MAADQVDAADGRVALAQAALAEKEREALEAIRGDICEWLGSLLAVDISGGSFMRALDTGVALCQLAALLQRRGAAEGDAAKEPVPITVNLKAERASFFARDNAASFLSWCRRLGVREEWLFESSGLVEHRDERRVVLCLLDLGRHAARLGLCAPQLVCMEKEIEALERLSAVGQETVGRETVVQETVCQEPAGQEAASQDGGSQVAVAAAVEEVPPVRQGGGDRECDADEQGPPPRKKQRREGGRAEAGMRPGAGVGAEAHVEEKVGHHTGPQLPAMLPLVT